VIENAKAVRSNGEVLIGIRPEHFEDARLVDTLGRSRGATFTAQISVLESMGSDNYAYFSVEGGQASAEALAEIAADAGQPIGSGQLIARLSPESNVSKGQSAELFYDTSKVSVFDQHSGANLSL
jgi:multiple sugar transport system ATP-binding protein